MNSDVEFHEKENNEERKRGAKSSEGWRKEMAGRENLAPATAGYSLRLGTASRAPTVINRLTASLYHGVWARFVSRNICRADTQIDSFMGNKGNCWNTTLAGKHPTQPHGASMEFSTHSQLQEYYSILVIPSLEAKV